MFHDGFMGGMWYGWIFWLVILVSNHLGDRQSNE